MPLKFVSKCAENDFLLRKAYFVSTAFQNLHPFYATLMNVLYNTDHYKLALGGINKARQLIDE